MNELALFAGAGGGILGGKLLGWRTVCAVEWDAYAAAVLCARQNDGILPPFPIWSDVQTFDGRPWRGRVDVVSGGFPCQDISAAGAGKGIDGERSGMWRHMARIVGEVRPRFVFVENSPMLVSRGLGRVLGDLAALGYDARWCVLGAIHTGAPHKRERIWIVADAASERRGEARELRSYESTKRTGSGGEALADASGNRRRQGRAESEGQQGGFASEFCRSSLADADGLRKLQPQGRECDGGRWTGDGGDEVCHATSAGLSIGPSESLGRSAQDAKSERSDREVAHPNGLHEQGEFSGSPDPQGRSEQGERQIGPRRDGGEWWESEPDVGRVAHGVAARVDRLRCLGNGQVPAVAALAWRTLTAA